MDAVLLGWVDVFTTATLHVMVSFLFCSLTVSPIPRSCTKFNSAAASLTSATECDVTWALARGIALWMGQKYTAISSTRESEICTHCVRYETTINCPMDIILWRINFEFSWGMGQKADHLNWNTATQQSQWFPDIPLLSPERDLVLGDMFKSAATPGARLFCIFQRVLGGESIFSLWR